MAPWGALKHPCRSWWLSPGSSASCPTHSSLLLAWQAGARARLLHPSGSCGAVGSPQPPWLSPARLRTPPASRLLSASRVQPDKHLCRAGWGEKAFIQLRLGGALCWAGRRGAPRVPVDLQSCFQLLHQNPCLLLLALPLGHLQPSCQPCFCRASSPQGSAASSSPSDGARCLQGRGITKQSAG